MLVEYCFSQIAGKSFSIFGNIFPIYLIVKSNKGEFWGFLFQKSKNNMA
jgi:hypothetical protein